MIGPLSARAAGWLAGAAVVAAMMAGLIALARRTLAHRLVVVIVHGASMRPAYDDGDRVVVRRGGPPKRGLVVVVERPTADLTWSGRPLAAGAGQAEIARRRWMIKRVVALPGDPVPRARVPRLVPGERVPPGALVLLGDNTSNSFDSRMVGYFPLDRVLGPVARSQRPSDSGGGDLLAQDVGVAIVLSELTQHLRVDCPDQPHVATADHVIEVERQEVSSGLLPAPLH